MYLEEVTRIMNIAIFWKINQYETLKILGLHSIFLKWLLFMAIIFLWTYCFQFLICIVQHTGVNRMIKYAACLSLCSCLDICLLNIFDLLMVYSEMYRVKIQLYKCAITHALLKYIGTIYCLHTIVMDVTCL